MAEVFMEGDLTEGMVEAMEAAGTGDRIRRCCVSRSEE
jgi:hypothetical protein